GASDECNGRAAGAGRERSALPRHSARGRTAPSATAPSAEHVAAGEGSSAWAHGPTRPCSPRSCPAARALLLSLRGRKRKAWWEQGKQYPPAPAGACDVEASWPILPPG